MKANPVVPKSRNRKSVSQKIKTVIKKAVKDLPLSFFPFKREVKG